MGKIKSAEVKTSNNRLTRSTPKAPPKAANDAPEKMPEAFHNGLAEAIGFGGLGFGGLGAFPQNQGSPWTEQLSSPTTMFKNLRWYLVSNFRQFLSELYVEVGLVQTIVDVPIDDALRGGVKIKSKQLEESEVVKLQSELKRDNDIQNIGQAMKWCRLFGGGGVLILTDQDPETELDVESIDKDTPLEFRPVDMWELFWDKQNTEGYDPTIQQADFEFYNYYGERVHKSRVMQLKGLTAPSFIKPRLRGWGFSVVEKLVRSINQYLKATDLSFEVLDEFKLDIYKIKGLSNSLMNPAAEAKIRQRITLGNWQKNYQNALTMDAEDDYDHKQLSFAGLAETMAGIRTQVASDMRMPITKLFGISAQGFNSGEDDIEVYNSMVESEVRAKIEFHILKAIEIKCQKLFGFIPDDIEIEFKPLRVLSSLEEETVKTQKFQRIETAYTGGHLSEKEYRDALNRENLLGIQLETSDEELQSLNDFNSEDEAVETEEDDGKTKDTDDPPGADEPDKERPTAHGKPKEVQRPKRNLNWDESEHPRSDDGKFGSGGKGPKAKPMASIADNGQIKIREPKSVSEASELLKTVLEFHSDAEKAVEDNPSSEAKLRLRHAAKQLIRAQKLAKETYDMKVSNSDPPLDPSQENGKLIILPKPFSAKDMRKRLRNSAAFDRASYEADGGDARIDPRRKYFFENPVGVNKTLWAEAEQASMNAYGQIKWQFVLFMYSKLGGRFNASA